MDTKQIEYILEIAKENNITKAAEKLFITQPALNQQLLKLEKELGVQLFHRSRTDWRPTEAGLVYLENARRMLLIKQDTYRQIGDMVTFKKGTLSIGFTPGRGIDMFSAVYPKFHKEFPEIIVTPNELSVKKQQIMIAGGELDIGFLTLRSDNYTADEYIPIAHEEIFLGIPARHPLSEPHLRRDPSAPFPVLNITAVQYEPFVLMYKESTIRQLVDGIFQQAGFQPNVLFETANTNTILTMICSNLCCGLIPYHYFRKKQEKAVWFSLPSHPTWDFVASYRKGSYLTHAAKHFIKLVTEYSKK